MEGEDYTVQEVVMSLEQQAKFWRSELRALAEDARTGADPFGVRLRSYELAQHVVSKALQAESPEQARGLAHVSELVAAGHFFAARDALLETTTPS
jgi:hypothetical protein